MGGYATVVLPDAEGALRTHLRDGVDLGPASGMIFFDVPPIPKGLTDVPLPLITLGRVGGLPDDELPIDHPVIGFSVWGNTKREAAVVAGLLIAALRSIGGSQTEEALFDGTSDISGPTWSPDDAAGKARYVVVATIHLRPTAAAG
jgi:hypothetical protein